MIQGCFMNIKEATGATVTFADLHKDNRYKITDYGAKSNGNPVTNTDAVNLAIKTANEAGGGTVVIPKGDFKTYTIRLKSNVNIYIEKNSILRAAKTDINKSYQKQQGEGGNYDEPEVNRYAGLQDHGHTFFANSLLYGKNIENVMIYGKGLINGSCMNPETGYREYVLQGGDPFENPKRNEKGHTGEWFGNKAIALLGCKNVILKDFSILIGGHFAMIAEGVTNMRVENILVDTTRDAFDVDCCQDVTVVGCTFNSLTDDALVLKASFGAGIFMPTKNVLIEDCIVSGYDAGSVYAGKYTMEKLIATDRCGPTARVKLGTESTCGYEQVTIRRVKFDRSRGFALEAVDASDLSDIIFTDCTMDNISSSPIFIRTGERARFPVTGNSTEEFLYAKEENVRIDHTNWVLPNTNDYDIYPAKRYTPSYQRNQSVSVDGNSRFYIVNQENPTKINPGNVTEINGVYYLMTYDTKQKKYLPDMSKEIPKDKLCYYANAVGKNQMPHIHNIEISNIKITNADPRYPILIMGLTDAKIKNVTMKNIEVEYRGGMKMEHAVEQRQLNTNWKYSLYETKSQIQTLPWLVNTFFLKSEGLLPRVDWDKEKGAWKDDPYNVPELPEIYPEPSNFGILPAYGLYARHVEGVEFSNIKISCKIEDERHAIVLDDVKNIKIQQLDAAVMDQVATIATITNHFKRHTNLEYVKNEEYFTTKVENLELSKAVTVKDVVINAPSPGTPNDNYYSYPTLPIPENGYHYKIPTDQYPLPLTVFRPFLAHNEKQSVKVTKELTLYLKIRNPAAETTMEETDGYIYNEAVTNKDYIVKGLKQELKVCAQNLPKGAVFDEKSRCLHWIPEENQVGNYEIIFVIDDGILKEEKKVSIEVKCFNKTL
jgi:polygalacturonase